MLLFAVCCNCQATIEERSTLDLAGFLPWRCPRCGATNEPIGVFDVEENVIEAEEYYDGEEITIEERDANPEDLKDYTERVGLV